MKLKIHPEVFAILKQISEINPDITPASDDMRPVAILNKFRKDLRLQQETMPGKWYTHIRRHLSFVYAIMHLLSVRDFEYRIGDNRYCDKCLINETRKLIADAPIIDIVHIKYALKYGVLYLSDHEIAKLIELNT